MRENAAQVKADNERFPADLLAKMPYGAVLLDGEGVIQSANASACAMCGFREDDLTGQALDILVSSSDEGTKLNQLLSEMRQGGSIKSIPFGKTLGKRKDGSRYAVELVSWPLPSSFGDLQAVILRDIDEDVKRDDRYRILFESSDYPQLIIVDNKFEFANEAAVRAFGCDSIEDLKSIHPSQISPEFQPDGRDSFSKAEEMMAIAYGSGGHRFDWVHTKKNGIEMLMDVILTAMPHMGSDALYCGYRDITERQKTEEVLRRTQKMDAIGQLTGGIAHDYNNILGVISGNLEILQRRYPEDEFAQGRILAALAGATRGADVTKKLLAFSHEKEASTKTVNVNRPIREFENLIGKSLTSLVSTRLQLSRGLWPVEIDLGDFENVILNLALNAKDAMPTGGVLKIKTSNVTVDEEYARANEGARSGDFVLISVSDTGTGMTDEVREKIFEPFFTTKEEGKGTGLGMSMVYGFIKQSQGHVRIESEPGKGTAFHIYLPRVAGEGAGETFGDEHPHDLPRGTETVLVVDDEVALLEVACALLNEMGYTTIAATSGCQALEILSQRSDIDALFSDVVLSGGMDGFQLALNAKEKVPRLTVQLTSGYTKQYEQDEESNESVSHTRKGLSRSLLKKPYNRQELAVTLRAALDEETE